MQRSWEHQGLGTAVGGSHKGKEEVRNFKMLRLKTEKIIIPLKSNLT